MDLDTTIREEASALVAEARDAGVTLACAESCTGGLVSGAITAVPGSSEVLVGGVVSYAIAVKRALLGVDDAILDDPSLGAVSSECALQMCGGVARLLDADIAVSVTGIAGPGGAEPGKPVGTVWFGLDTPLASRTLVRHFEGSRDEVRSQAVSQALELLRAGVKEISVTRS